MRRFLIYIALSCSALFAFDLDAFIDFYSSLPEPEEPENITYMSTESFTEFEDKDFQEIKARYTGSKKYTQIGDSTHVEIIEEHIEGDFDEDKEENEDGGEGRDESMSMEDGPFGREQKKDYDFTYEGTQYFNGEETHIVRFESKKRDKEHFNGRALFGVSDSLMKKIELRFAKNPLVMKDFKMVMEFAYPGGFMFPSRFYMKARVKILLYDRNFEADVKHHDIEIL